MSQTVCGIGLNFFRRSDKPPELLAPLPELSGHLLADLIFEKLPLQFGFELAAFLLVPGQKGNCLDINQAGGHLEEFTRQLEVRILCRADVRHVLFEQGGDLHIIDVQLVLGDQVEQQVERAFKFRSPERKLFHYRINRAIRLTQPVAKSSSR